jgi:hypothetical protein
VCCQGRSPCAVLLSNSQWHQVDSGTQTALLSFIDCPTSFQSPAKALHRCLGAVPAAAAPRPPRADAVLRVDMDENTFM